MVGGSTRGRPRRKPGAPRGRGRPPRDGRAKPPTLTACFISRCGDILDRLKKKDHYNIFLEPVDPNVVAEYDTIVKTPMAISTMSNKLHSHQYKSLGEFRRDLDLMWNNCLLFNGTEPNNIFTKKAIELQKVTDKLISAARQELERDKEEINLWKEKHRRNKPANPGESKPDPAQEALLSTSTEIPAGEKQGDNQRSNSAAATPDNNRSNPRAAYEYAMRQLLRAQYGDNSGLHKRNHEDSTPHHYMTPEGTPVQIGSVRYNPYEGGRWERFEEIRRSPQLPLKGDEIFTRLPQSSQPQNVCSPLEQRDFVNVKAYVESLQAYVKDAGEIPSRIIAEFLGPELAFRETMEKRKRRKLNSGSSSAGMGIGSEGANIAAAAASVGEKDRNNDNGNNDGGDGNNNDRENGASKMTDPLMASCRYTMLNNPPRKIAEFEGEGGLVQFMSANLAEQVKNVPVSVIDFATPYGVCAQSLAEVIHLARMPGALNIDPSHVRNLEEIHRATADFAARQDPRAVAAMGGASSLNPAQIHDFQLKLTHTIEALTRVMPDRKVIPQKMQLPAGSSINNGNANSNIAAINNKALQLQADENARRVEDQNAKSRNRARSSVASYQTRNPSQADGLHPMANGLLNRANAPLSQAAAPAPAPLANVLGPMGNLAPLQNQRRPNSLPGNVNVQMGNPMATNRQPNNSTGHFFNSQAAASSSHPMKALPIPNHPNPHTNHLNHPNRQQPQNGITPAMHSLMNPTPTPVSQAQVHQQQQQQQPALRPLANPMNMPMQSTSAAAARLASMGMMINTVPNAAQQQQLPNAATIQKNDANVNNNALNGNSNVNMPTLSTNNGNNNINNAKTPSVLAGILSDNSMQVAAQQQQQIMPHHQTQGNVERLAQLQMPNALLNNNNPAGMGAVSAPQGQIGRQQQHAVSQAQLQPATSLIPGNQRAHGHQLARNVNMNAGNMNTSHGMGNVGNVGNLASRNVNNNNNSTNLQSLGVVRNNGTNAQASPHSSQPLGMNHLKDNNTNPIRHQNMNTFANNATEQAGMTAARAPVQVSAPAQELAVSMPASVPVSNPVSVSTPMQFPNPGSIQMPTAMAGADLMAPIFGTNETNNNNGAGGGAANANNNNTVAGSTNGNGNGNADSPQLDNIFSFDGGALGDGGGAADFGF